MDRAGGGSDMRECSSLQRGRSNQSQVAAGTKMRTDTLRQLEGGAFLEVYRSSVRVEAREQSETEWASIIMLSSKVGCWYRREKCGELKL
jgi:hypothetical protein